MRGGVFNRAKAERDLRRSRERMQNTINKTTLAARNTERAFRVMSERAWKAEAAAVLLEQQVEAVSKNARRGLGDECTICCEVYDAGDHLPSVMTPCGHAVCLACAHKVEWQCPFCRGCIHGWVGI